VIYGYARVSTDGQSVAAQVSQLKAAGCEKVFREVASGTKTDRNQLRRLLEQLTAGDVLVVTRLDRLARSTRDLLNTLAVIAAKKAGFRSLSDAWADTTTAHGRLMLTPSWMVWPNSSASCSVPAPARGERSLRRGG
jgi:DNA invertase Pin-like site-specific DNA recombinase